MEEIRQAVNAEMFGIENITIGQILDSHRNLQAIMKGVSKNEPFPSDKIQDTERLLEYLI